jgi:hypothetical protein
MKKRAIGTLLCAIAVATFASLAARAAGPEVKGGIEGKVVSVDVAKGSVVISSEGSEKTFSVTAATTIVGPRGGAVRRRLHDPRFHEGLPITVVANGNTATQLLLGVDRKSAKPGDAASTKTGTSRSSGFRGADAAKSEESEDDDNDFPGKIKSVDPDKHMLVITLLTGKDRSFMLSSDVKLTIGRRVSQKGLSDPALKPGAGVTVVTDEGGRKVKEVKVSFAGGMRSGGPRRLGVGLRPPQSN